MQKTDTGANGAAALVEHIALRDFSFLADEALEENVPLQAGRDSMGARPEESGSDSDSLD